MLRSLTTALCLFLGVASLCAQDLGRTDRLWRMYLSETVRRGLPLMSAEASLVPYWPALDRARYEAQSLEPGPDVVLLGAWIDQAQSQTPSVEALKAAWPRPASRFAAQWGETLFAFWDAGGAPREWTDAWLAWQDKAYHPRALLRGLEVFEKTDDSAVVPLLTQAVQLYPEDRRFLALVARHPEAVLSAEGLLARDPTRFAPATLRGILSRKPQARELLLRAGYTEAELSSAQTGDYAAALASGTKPGPGKWTWDSDGDGGFETTLVFDEGLASWTRHGTGLWTLGFRNGLPESLTESRSGASWVLKWEAYPWASVLEYRWGDRKIVYRFRPLAQSVPLWPAERFQASADQLPAALAALWLPLDPRALAASAATVETWNGTRKISTVFLYQGEVWQQVEDSDQDGRDDTWSYFRGGRLASVYHDAEGRGQAGLRELYQKGELTQVQSKGAVRNEFVLFPAEGIQLWDPHGDGRPLERLFVWSGDKLGALVFHQQTLPWETMPPWEPRP